MGQERKQHPGVHTFAPDEGFPEIEDLTDQLPSLDLSPTLVEPDRKTRTEKLILCPVCGRQDCLSSRLVWV